MKPAVIALLMLIAAVLALKPHRWEVARTAFVQASPEEVYDRLADLRQWNQWTVWQPSYDPSLKARLIGPQKAVGSQLHWESQELGEGTVELTHLDPPATIALRGRLPAPVGDFAGSFALAWDGAATRITWQMEGKVGWLIWRRLILTEIESILGQKMSDSLTQLAQNVRISAAAVPTPQPH